MGLMFYFFCVLAFLLFLGATAVFFIFLADFVEKPSLYPYFREYRDWDKNLYLVLFISAVLSLILVLSTVWFATGY